jgi:hypothetical protein
MLDSSLGLQDSGILDSLFMSKNLSREESLLFTRFYNNAIG